MLKRAKRSLLKVSRSSGWDGVLLRSRWRSSRLLILCYHGLSLEREHEWDSNLYMSPGAFAKRLELLKKNKCEVLALEEALELLKKGSLPPRSVAITFDDGTFDFHEKAMPLLKSFGFPATVYLTSFYASFNRPVFSLACSYLLWKHQDGTLKPLSFTDSSSPISLNTAANRAGVLRAIQGWVETEKPSAEEQYAGFEELAKQLGADAAELTEKRILHIMTPAEVASVARNGFDVQLHTHRHRTPCDASLFTREIEDNRRCIQEWTAKTAQHFCYPNGTVPAKFETWLPANGITSAVTCVPGLTSASHNPLLLPRLVDHSGLSEEEFESWISGVGSWLRVLKPGG